MRRVTSPLVLALLLSAGCGGGGNDTARPDGPAAPNFVVVILDDWGWRDYGAIDPQVQTPNIDFVAQQGFTFGNAFLTTSSCTASRASILMGRYPTATGAPHLHDPVPDGFTSIPEQLRRRGYYTAATGKWHLGDRFMSRFDVVFDSSTGVTDSDWPRLLRERPRKRPFFLWLASLDPHVPHDAPQPFRVHDPAAITMPDYLADTPGSRQAYAAYLDEVNKVDFYLGEFLSALRAEGLLENTWLFLLADNGAPTPFAKATLYDTGIKTPLLVLGPGTVGRYDGLVSSVDLAPTILDLAGGVAPGAFQGRSFRRAFEDPQYEHRTFVYAEQNNHSNLRGHTAVRSLDYLLIHNYFHERACVSEMPPMTADLRALLARGAASELQVLCINALPPVQFFRVGEAGYEAHNLAAADDYSEARQLHAERLSQWEAQYRGGACVTLECAQAVPAR